jgi:mono/diheme cytochrome c family protein
MAEVVSYSTSLLTDADLHAIASYLKEQSAGPNANPQGPDAGAMKRGGAVFSDACTACHMEEGRGQARIFPPLRDNVVSQQADPTEVLQIILAGDRTAATNSRLTPLSMPSFAWKLTDQQIVDVANYVRNSWGNRAQPVTAKQVGDMRRNLGTLVLHSAIGKMLLARWRQYWFSDHATLRQSGYPSDVRKSLLAQKASVAEAA